MSRIRFPIIMALFLLASRADVPLRADGEKPLDLIAFGSCVKEDQPQPIWDAIAKLHPDVFLFIGDNIYGDSQDMSVLRAKWAKLGAHPGYKKLKSVCPILATWDDHDYGVNDGGAEYPKKKESQQVFLDFFDEPTDSPRRRQEGVYDAKVFGPPGRRVQIILLDTRYFRSRLQKGDRGVEPGEGDTGGYVASDDPDATMLGETQWQWLERQLRVPAEARIVASSIQAIAEDHGWEKWANMPRERERLFKLIADTHADGVVIISGDRHSAEISATDPGVGYTLYDVTSSSLNRGSKWHNEINRHRVGLVYTPANFGTIAIDWKQPDPVLRLQVRGEDGEVVLQQRVKLNQLHAGPGE